MGSIWACLLSLFAPDLRAAELSPHGDGATPLLPHWGLNFQLSLPLGICLPNELLGFWDWLLAIPWPYISKRHTFKGMGTTLTQGLNQLQGGSLLCTATGSCEVCNWLKVRVQFFFVLSTLSLYAAKGSKGCVCQVRVLCFVCLRMLRSGLNPCHCRSLHEHPWHDVPRLVAASATVIATIGSLPSNSFSFGNCCWERIRSELSNTNVGLTLAYCWHCRPSIIVNALHK